MKIQKKINSCRLCNSKQLNKIIDFGKIALGNNLQKKKYNALNAKKFNLCLNNCKKCNHFQLSNSVSPKILYQTNYTYLTGVSNTFNKHFLNYSSWLEKKINNKKRKKSILDVGSNDGTCLCYFKEKGYYVIGVDPAQTPAKIANNKGIQTINNFFNKKTSKEIVKQHGRFDVITSHNVLAHIENIEETFLSIYDSLKSNGHFCFEIGYFHDVLKKNLFDTIYHEHLDYHHANPLCSFLNRIGFSVKNLSTNSIQGGSLRVLCKKEKKVQNSKQVDIFRSKEKNSILFNRKYLRSWEVIIKNKMKIYGDAVKSFSRDKFTKIGYGSPTKVVLLMKLSGLDSKDINYIIEDNKLKINRFLPTTGVKINKFTSQKMNKTLVISVFAWNFYEEIVNKLKRTLPLNSIIICPLPNFKIIKL